jgi:hypothetical protein
MPQVLDDSPEAFGPRKRKLSEKATTNGDPNVERKQKRLAQVEKIDAALTIKTTQASAKTMAPAKPPTAKITAPAKKKASTKMTTTSANLVPMVAKQAGPTGLSKPRPRRSSVEVEEVDDGSDCLSYVSPRNPRRILEAADGSDDNIEGPLEPIVIDIDDEGPEETDVVEEIPEEDDEAELSL